ncbi:hypothetical protein HS088_TW15G00864 [Tripterygium wilfordii]|uniref:Deubiquitinating enzyme MINDY-3/4 conserved domain-containing protein n=1 Tax=Tripterygium wilfordii TaxID=458696 RepID=A0A7J7CMQ0_TRIWF|nr:hypothetical protein HS088_TW15G00864 [Tripterygium wilfordii]
MADREEDDLRMALRMSMQQESPEPKRSKPRDTVTGTPEDSPEESPEAENRRVQRELMAAAAEKRMMAARITSPSKASSDKTAHSAKGEKDLVKKGATSGKELSPEEANQLFSMVFGAGVSKDILAQWSNQGIRFSPDPETSMGLVQHEGGPCGVLATIQAFVFKYILFSPDDLGNVAFNTAQNFGARSLSKGRCVASTNFASLTEDAKARALVRSMGEILFLCGGYKRAVIAKLSSFDQEDISKDEIIAKELQGLTIESASDLQKFLRVDEYASQASAFQRLEVMIPVFESRMGAMLFLISALLSRGLDSVQADRDDPSLPLVTAPFGHASQEQVRCQE